MNTRWIEILKILSQKENYITASELANTLKVSVRTIKKDISDINKTSNAKVIFSSKQGYKVNQALATNLLSSNSNNSLQTYKDRANYITKQFIFEHKNSISIPRLCSTLYISDTTLRNDLSKLNKSLKSYNISFEIKNDLIYIVGNERDMRKFISSTVYEEVGNYYITLDSISKNFHNFDSLPIKDIILKSFSKQNCYINDVALLNLVLHIAIIIDRILNGKTIKNHYHATQSETTISWEITIDICKQLENKYDINIDYVEQKEIFILINANCSTENEMNETQLEEYAGKKALSLAKTLIKLTEDKYMINLSNQSFLVPFTLHLKNLIYRSENNINLINPSCQNIINSFPTVSDIAIYMSVQIIDKYKLNCPIGEISFLALHIGGEMERQKNNSTKVTTVLLCPNYMDLEDRIYKNLLQMFDSELNIIKVVHSYHELKYLHFELLISVVDIPYDDKWETVIISPFISQINKSKMMEKIELCKSHKKNHILRANFNSYFEKDLFWIDKDDITTSKDAISYICNQLTKMEYVKDDFCCNVLKREQISSTAFNDIAIPHSIEPEGYKTSISILINHNGIHWNNQKVKIVILLSASPYESRDFYNLYEALILLFNNKKNIDLFLSCTNFSDFQKTLFSLIKTN